MSVMHSRLLPLPLQFTNTNGMLPYPTRRLSYPCLRQLSVFCAKRAGKRRYPSEKKKLKLKQKEAVADVENKFEGIWRLSKLGVLVQNDPGKDFIGLSDGLLQEIATVLEFPVASMLPTEAFTVVRKSFDARKVLKEPKFVYTVDIDVEKLLNLEPHTYDFISRLEPKVGLVEHLDSEKVCDDLISIINGCKRSSNSTPTGESKHEISCWSTELQKHSATRKPKVAVVGSGPSGLFASLVLAEFGADVTLIERGQAVEQRGRDIGRLVVRRILELESNFCFGEVLGVMESW